MYRTRTVPGAERDGGGDGFRASRSRHHRKAARVLPLPVGAWISVCLPVEMDFQPPTWAGVGASKADSNQARTAGENGASGSSTGAVETGAVARAERGRVVAVTGGGVYPARGISIRCSTPGGRLCPLVESAEGELERLPRDLRCARIRGRLGCAVGQAGVRRIVERRWDRRLCVPFGVFGPPLAPPSRDLGRDGRVRRREPDVRPGARHDAVDVVAA